jgi:hypothetical protein
VKQTETVRTSIPTVLAGKLKAFCKRVSLTQPQVIRTLVFNVLTTYHPAAHEEKTSLFKGARSQQRHFDNYEGGLISVDAVLAVRQGRQLDTLCAGIGLNRGGVIRVLLRNFIRTTKPGQAEDTFLLTARRLKSRQPSSPLWGNGCERSADQRFDQALDFMRQHPKRSSGETAAALRGLGIRHSREWIEDVRN